MNRKEYDNLLELLDQEYKRVLDKYAEYKQKREAIDIVWKMTGARTENTSTVRTVQLMQTNAQHKEEQAIAMNSVIDTNGASLDDLGHGELQTNIRNVIAHLSDTFSIREIKAGLAELYPNMPIREPSVRTALQRICKKGEITLEFQGTGRAPSTYKKTSQ